MGNMMQPDFQVTAAYVTQCQEQLESIIPTEVDGTAAEGELLVRYRYVPHSLQFEDFIENSEIDPLTPYLTAWTYLLEESEVREDRLLAPARFQGQVLIPVAHDGTMMTNDLDFITGLLTATEGDTHDPPDAD
jgi:hypothetical protein